MNPSHPAVYKIAEAEPDKANAVPITANSTDPASFPCWLLHYKAGWTRFETNGLIQGDWLQYGWTHWCLDLPSLGTTASKEAPEERHGRIMQACEEARREVGKLPYGGPERQALHDSAMKLINQGTVELTATPVPSAGAETPREVSAEALSAAKRYIEENFKHPDAISELAEPAWMIEGVVQSAFAQLTAQREELQYKLAVLEKELSNRTIEREALMQTSIKYQSEVQELRADLSAARQERDAANSVLEISGLKLRSVTDQLTAAQSALAECGKDKERINLLEWLGETSFFPDWDDNGFWFAKMNGHYVNGTTLRQFCDAAIEARSIQGGAP